MENHKNQVKANTHTKKENDMEEGDGEKNEDYLVVDKDDEYIEPADPKKEDLNNADFLDNDDEDDEVDEF